MNVCKQNKVFTVSSLLAHFEKFSGQLEKHIELMKEILPEWMKSLKIRKETYLKIDKRKELKDLTNQITKILKEEKRK